MKAFFKTLSIYLGVPGAVVIFLLLWGVEIRLPVLPFVVGPIFILLVAIGVGAETTYRVIKKDREKVTDNFDSINIDARKNRALRDFYNLYESGLLYKNGDLALKQKWDKEVKLAVKTHCDTGGLSTYSSYTKRSVQPDNEINEDDQYEGALKFIKHIMDNNFNEMIRE